MIYTKEHGVSGILCPNDIHQGLHPLHEMRVRMVNRFYTWAKEHGKLDSDGEWIDQDWEDAYYAVDKHEDNYMQLYGEHDSVIAEKAFLHVRTWYYKCSVCGFVLPTEARARP